jgi:hypothetical protein
MEIDNRLVFMYIRVSEQIVRLTLKGSNLFYKKKAHLTSYPGLADPKDMLNGVIEFIKSINKKQDVWFVTNQQLLQWMKNPVKASELAKQDYMQCNQPVLSKDICNGLDDDHNGSIDDGLVNRFVL